MSLEPPLPRSSSLQIHVSSLILFDRGTYLPPRATPPFPKKKRKTFLGDFAQIPQPELGGGYDTPWLRQCSPIQAYPSTISLAYVGNARKGQKLMTEQLNGSDSIARRSSSSQTSSIRPERSVEWSSQRKEPVA